MMVIVLEVVRLAESRLQLSWQFSLPVLLLLQLLLLFQPGLVSFGTLLFSLWSSWTWSPAPRQLSQSGGPTPCRSPSSDATLWTLPSFRVGLYPGFPDSLLLLDQDELPRRRPSYSALPRPTWPSCAWLPRHVSPHRDTPSRAAVAHGPGVRHRWQSGAGTWGRLGFCPRQHGIPP